MKIRVEWLDVSPAIGRNAPSTRISDRVTRNEPGHHREKTLQELIPLVCIAELFLYTAL